MKKNTNRKQTKTNSNPDAFMNYMDKKSKKEAAAFRGKGVTVEISDWAKWAKKNQK
jgi:hypothetical protein